MPQQLQFFVVGHDGPPEKPAQGKNSVRLIDAATGELLAEIAAPRNDTAQRVEWRFPAIQGRPVFIEIVDRDAAGAYAWIGAGRFSINALNPHPDAPLPQSLRLITEFQLVNLKPSVIAKMQAVGLSLNERVACLQTLNSLSPDPRVTALLGASTAPLSAAAIDRLAHGMIHHESAAIDEVLEQTLRASAATAQRPLALELASSRPGAMTFLALLERGVASRRLLLDGSLKERLQSTGIEGIDEQIAKLTDGLTPVSAEVEAFLNGRRKGFAQTLFPGDKSVDEWTEAKRRAITQGREVFKRNCAACHQFQGEGAKIGPQLDGVGKRGADRLLEDMIDPNRNVDAAFRSTTLVLRDGKVVTGLVRREEGATLILADEKGKEFSVLLSEIEIRRLSDLSLMPEKLGETLKESDMYDLLHYLMSGA